MMCADTIQTLLKVTGFEDVDDAVAVKVPTLLTAVVSVFNGIILAGFVILTDMKEVFCRSFSGR